MDKTKNRIIIAENETGIEVAIDGITPIRVLGVLDMVKDSIMRSLDSTIISQKSEEMLK